MHQRPTDRQLLSRLVPLVAAAATGTRLPGDPPPAARTAGPRRPPRDPPREPREPGSPGAAEAAGAAGATDRRAGGDAVARRILEEAAAHLAELAGAVRARLGASCRSPESAGSSAAPPSGTRSGAATGATDPAEPPELGALRLLDRA